MPLNIRSEEVNQLVGKLASRAGVSKTEPVRLALRNELRRREQRIPLAEPLKRSLDRMDAFRGQALRPTRRATMG